MASISEQSNGKTIAKNTVFLYFRMLFTMVVALYTSRVVLQVLGVDDFGVYHAVGGVVTMLAFVNGALSTGSSRFLTFELGTGNFEKLKLTFSSVLTVHIILALLVVLVAETLGLWFVYNKLVIAPDRMDAAIWVYHISILTVLVSITQVPYNASIISHEKMGIYAYTSIVEVSLKLGIVYLLTIGDYDKLVLYAILLCLVQIGIAFFYRIYCIRNFSETHYYFVWDKNILKGILSYSGWNLIANTAHALNNQGATILINMFFSPAVVAARSIANQVNMAATQFINNFRTAVNPQIVKRYAAGNLDGSKRLLLLSTRFSYYLMLILCLPICLLTDTILSLWLTEVPDYTAPFLQITIITSLFQVFDSSFYTALYAKGRIKENALVCPTLGILVFPIVYLMFKNGYSPVCLAWALLVHYAINGLIVKPILINRIVGYNWREILSVFTDCFRVTIGGVVIPIVVYYNLSAFNLNRIFSFFVILAISIFSVLISVWFIGMDRTIRKKVISFIKKKLSNRKL